MSELLALKAVFEVDFEVTFRGKQLPNKSGKHHFSSSITSVSRCLHASSLHRFGEAAGSPSVVIMPQRCSSHLHFFRFMEV